MLSAVAIGAVLLFELLDCSEPEEVVIADGVDGMQAFESLSPTNQRVVLCPLDNGEVLNVQVGLRTYTSRHTVSIKWEDNLTYQDVLGLVLGAHILGSRKSADRAYTVCLMKYDNGEWVAASVGLEAQGTINRELLAGGDRALWVVPKYSAPQPREPNLLVSYKIPSGDGEGVASDPLQMNLLDTVGELVERVLADAKVSNTESVVFLDDEPLMDSYGPNTRLGELASIVADSNWILGLSVRPSGSTGNKRQRKDPEASIDAKDEWFIR